MLYETERSLKSFIFVRIERDEAFEPLLLAVNLFLAKN